MKKNRISKIILISITLVLTLYFATGIYTLQSGQNALIIRFGKVLKEVTKSGIHYHLPLPFEKAIKAHVSEVKKVLIQKSDEEEEFNDIENFTGDENLILVRAAISYDIRNLSDYLFNSKDVSSILEATGEMHLNHELAKMKVDNVMTTGKSLLRFKIKEEIQKTLDDLKIGIRIISVELTDISPPMSVSSSFKAVSDAKEKKQEIIKEAEGYANSIIPNARGKSNSIILEARAYSNEVLNSSKGDAKAFNDILVEYNRSPEITYRLKYLETIQNIFKKCNVSIDSNPSNSTYYIEKQEQK